jgi:hypothetical protein
LGYDPDVDRQRLDANPDPDLDHQHVNFVPDRDKKMPIDSPA